MELLDHVDPRLRDGLRAEVSRRSSEPMDGLPRNVTVVLAGHRAAGKSTLLPHVARVLDRRAVDLDDELERRGGRSIRAWFASDQASFRAAERALFESLPVGVVVAVGGGFLSSHPEAFRGTVPVLVPVSFETFRERLLRDDTRPRLRPELSLEDELRQVFDEREQLHQRVPVMPLVDFLLAMRRSRARRVVTLPPGVDPTEFATLAKRDGADLLELRTDLVPELVDVRGLSQVLPLLVAERGSPVPSTWRAAATIVDSADGSLRSLHAPTPLTAAEALAQWKTAPSDV